MVVLNDLELYHLCDRGEWLHMWITEDQAIVMFARYCRARFGEAASQQVRAKARALEKRGDAKGHHAWTKVAQEIEKQAEPISPAA